MTKAVSMGTTGSAGKARGASDAASENEAPLALPEVPVMTGTHFHALDEKGRVIIPAKLRPAFTEQFWMMLDENDNIGIYNYRTGLDVLEHCERMIAEHPDDEDLAAAVERITGAAELMRVEGGWRVPIPEILRFHAQLDKEVVTVGLLNHAALWSRERWEAAQMRRLQSIEVKRAQAGLLRAAASSVRKSQEASVEAEGNVEQIAASAGEGVAGAILGTGAVGVARAGGTVGEERHSAAASTGDGRRSPRVLTLSRLGR